MLRNANSSSSVARAKPVKTSPSLTGFGPQAFLGPYTGMIDLLGNVTQ